jgi:hypothetical protein
MKRVPPGKWIDLALRELDKLAMWWHGNGRHDDEETRRLQLWQHTRTYGHAAQMLYDYHSEFSAFPEPPRHEVIGLVFPENIGQDAGPFEKADDFEWSKLDVKIAQDMAALKAYRLTLDKLFPAMVTGPGGSLIVNADAPRVGAPEMAEFGQLAAQAMAHVARAGVSSLFRGRRFFVAWAAAPFVGNEASPGHAGAGEYLHGRVTVPGDIQPRAGDIGIRLDAQPARLLHTVVHELGHAFYYEVLSPGARKRFGEFFSRASGHTTAYGSASAEEDFAESWTFLILKTASGKRADFSWSADAIERFRAFLRTAGAHGFVEPHEHHELPPFVFVENDPGGATVDDPFAGLDAATVTEAKAIGTAPMHGQVLLRDLAIRNQGAFDSTLRSRIRMAGTNAVRDLAPVVNEAERGVVALLFEWMAGRLTFTQMRVESAKVWRTAYEQVREIGRKASAIERHGPAVDSKMLHAEETWFRSAVREELRYWNTFLHEINEGQVSEERLMQRLEAYLKALRFMYEGARVLALPDNVLLYWMGPPRDDTTICEGCVYMMERSPFTKNTVPAVPRDGSTQCLTNCRHRIVVRVAGLNEVFRRAEQLPARDTMVRELREIKENNHGRAAVARRHRIGNAAHPHARNPFHDAPPLPPRTEPFNLSPYWRG